VTSTTTEPLIVIQNVHPVDDAGGEHYETTMTAALIMELVENGLLKLEGNIRPDHMPGRKMGAKTRRKIDAWAGELLQNEAVIGNISFRLDPDTSFFSIEEDEDGDDVLVLSRGFFDCGIDSLSRIKAIIKAGKSPAGTFDLDTRFAVRIWIADRDLGNKVAAVYNTRGDKVNDTAAKFAYQQSAEQRMARALMQGSPHLGLDNVEVLTNTVSASSHKLVAFNTLSQAIEQSWSGEPLDEAEESNQVEFLIGFWDELVKVRREFGRLTKADRQSLRGSSIAGTAISIHGVIAAADELYKNDVDPESVLGELNSKVELDDGTVVDYFSYDNPLWLRLGVLVQAPDKNGVVRKQLRMSFQTRREMGAELRRKLGLTDA
jgi:hypothetical protein